VTLSGKKEMDSIVTGPGWALTSGWGVIYLLAKCPLSLADVRFLISPLSTKLVASVGFTGKHRAVLAQGCNARYSPRTFATCSGKLIRHVGKERALIVHESMLRWRQLRWCNFRGRNTPRCFSHCVDLIPSSHCHSHPKVNILNVAFK
jgi:hypothetical protein